MIFATNNQNKLKELIEIFDNKEIKCLKDLNINIDILENGNSYYENALIKAKTIYDLVKIPTIADDSGLEFLEIPNYPGIYTNRIIDEAKKRNLTRNKFLIEKGKELKDKRIKAICCLVYYDGLNTISSEGIMEGEITDKEYQFNGFGFDSIFRLNDGRVVSSLTSYEKNHLSHRYQASIKLKKLLEEKNIL